MRLAPSTGFVDPNGIMGPARERDPRMYKSGNGNRLRGSRRRPRDPQMRYAGLDIAKEAHFVAVVSQDEEVLVKPKRFSETAEGYDRLAAALGDPKDVTVALESTGHYWRNVVAWLIAKGYAVVLLNPLRTRRFAEEDMLRAKTDAVDALSLARFNAQKRPTLTRAPDAATEALRELVHLRDRLVQDRGDRVRQLNRVVDLVFPEFTSLVKDLATHTATSILRAAPSAKKLAQKSKKALAKLKYDGRHTLGEDLATALVDRARRSVASVSGDPYELEVVYFCDDIELLNKRIASLDKRIDDAVEHHDLAKLLTTIDGIGNNTSARLLATLGDPSETFHSAKALAAYCGVVPGTKHSGKHKPQRASISPMGNADLRHKLWMPVLRAVTANPWLKATYERLKAAGKPRKVALIACLRKLLSAVYSVAKNRRPFELDIGSSKA